MTSRRFEGGSSRGGMTTVAILQDIVPQYRLPFFEALRDSLEGEGIRLRLGQGCPPSAFARRGDTGQTLAWATPLPQRRLGVGRHDLVWLDPRPVAQGADLVIATQEIRQLQSLALWGLQHAGRGWLCKLDQGQQRFDKD